MATVNDLIRFKGPGQVSFADANALLSSGNNRTMEAVKGLQETLSDTISQVESNTHAKAQSVIDSYNLADFNSEDGLAKYEMMDRVQDILDSTGMYDPVVMNAYINQREKNLIDLEKGYLGINEQELTNEGLGLTNKNTQTSIDTNTYELASRIQKDEAEQEGARINKGVNGFIQLTLMEDNYANKVKAFRDANGADAVLPDSLVAEKLKIDELNADWNERFGNIFSGADGLSNLTFGLQDYNARTEKEKYGLELAKQKLTAGELQMKKVAQDIVIRGESHEANMQGRNAVEINGDIAPAAFASYNKNTGQIDINMFRDNITNNIDTMLKNSKNAYSDTPNAKFITDNLATAKEVLGDGRVQAVNESFYEVVRKYESDHNVKLSDTQKNYVYNSILSGGIQNSLKARRFWETIPKSVGINSAYYGRIRNAINEGLGTALNEFEQQKTTGANQEVTDYLTREVQAIANATGKTSGQVLVDDLGITPKVDFFKHLSTPFQQQVLDYTNTSATQDIAKAGNTGEQGTGAPAQPQQPAEQSDAAVAIDAANEQAKEQNAVGKTTYTFGAWKPQERRYMVPTDKFLQDFDSKGVPKLKGGVGKLKISDKSKIKSRNNPVWDIVNKTGLQPEFINYVVQYNKLDLSKNTRGDIAKALNSMLTNMANGKHKKLPSDKIFYYHTNK